MTRYLVGAIVGFAAGLFLGTLATRETTPSARQSWREWSDAEILSEWSILLNEMRVRGFMDDGSQP